MRGQTKANVSFIAVHSPSSAWGLSGVCARYTNARTVTLFDASMCNVVVALDVGVVVDKRGFSISSVLVSLTPLLLLPLPPETILGSKLGRFEAKNILRSTYEPSYFVSSIVRLQVEHALFYNS